MSRTARLRFAAALLFVLGMAPGCGGTRDTSASSSTGAGSGAGGASSSGGISTTSGGGGAGGQASIVAPPVCLSPSGFEVCNGPNLCPDHATSCGVCGATTYDDPQAISWCDNDAWEAWLDAKVASGHEYEWLCGGCADGDVCVGDAENALALSCVPFEVGALFAQNGAALRVRYADSSKWTGDPLPEPGDCPAIQGAQLCGGKCGGCPTGYACTGRSPLHPYGMCFPLRDFGIPPLGHSADMSPDECRIGAPCTNTNNACFVWKVQPELQADAFGACLPPANCQAAAASIPGGAICVPP